MPRISAFQSRFFWKTYLTFAVLFFITTILVSSIGFYRIQSTIQGIILDNLHAKAEFLLPTARQIFAKQLPEAESQLRQLGTATKTGITLIAPEGQVLVDSASQASTMENHWQRPEVQQALVEPFGFAERHSLTMGQPLLYLAKAVRAADGQILGVVRVSLSTDKIHGELTQLRWTMLLIASLGVMLALGIGWNLASRVAIPIREMVQVAEAMRNGHYEQKVRTITDDELGQLGETLNRLGAELTGKIAELHRLETVRRDFVANVSHEIKTPLTSIKGYVETLLGGAINEPRTSLRFLEKIERNSNRLGNLVQDLLSLARIEATEDSLSLAPIDWCEVINSVIARNEDVITQKGLLITVSGTNIPQFVMGDREAMTQVLDNLLTNAIKYTAEGGHVSVGLSTSDTWLRLTVEDTGLGIPTEHLDRIFERFYRVDKARSRELGGTGLGLSIVKHLTAAMGGEVHVQSNVGIGSKFSVLLRFVAQV